MNNNLYRIIFNLKRGQMMAVAETASAEGKTGSGQTANSLSSSPSLTTRLSNRLITALQPLPYAIYAIHATLGMMTILSPLAQAQIVADPHAPASQRPIILNTANGLPLVNIQTPSAAGVSRNTYQQFDVQPNGVVLNNSRTNVQTQLGGFVQGNPYLANGGARVILNEVNSSNPSHLRGYTEVAGQRAEVVIANPAGINISGAGFINASRVTLTTGTALLNNANGGNLDSYRVLSGSINVDGAGLDTSTADFTAILARSDKLNAGIWARELLVTTGTNVIDAATGHATPSGAKDSTPKFSLDSSLLGGMYAGKITLVGTESGVGVSNAGVIGATAGNVTIDVNGWLSNSGSIQATEGSVHMSVAGELNNSGQLQAQDLNLQASTMTNSGKILAIGQVALTSQGAIDNTGSIEGQRLALIAGGDIRNTGSAARITQNGTLALGVSAVALSNTDGAALMDRPLPKTPDATADSSSGTATPTDSATGGSTTSTPSAGSSTTITNTGTVTVNTDNTGIAVPVVAPVAVLLPGLIQAGGSLINSQGTINSGGAMTLTTSQIDNSGGVIRIESLGAPLAMLTNRSGSLTLASGAVNLTGATVDNHAGTLSTAGPLLGTATSFDNRGGIVQTSSVQLSVGGLFNNHSG